MIPVPGFEGSRVALLGLGRSGLAAARSLAAGGAEPVVWDDNPEARARAEAEGFDCADLRRDGAFESVAGLVVSPGVPHLYPEPNPVVRAAQDAGVQVDNEIGLFFRAFATEGFERFESVPRVVAVTGSNGKSTTAALLHHVLSRAGRPAQLGGNIGRAALDLDPASDGETVVLELSSYQIELARALTPDIAVFTNFAPDHLDRHGGLGGYFAAKRRLFAEGGPDRAVIGVDEAEGRFLAGQMAELPGDDRVVRIASDSRPPGPGWSVFARKGFLAERRGDRQIASIDLRGIAALPGAHNHQNACAAYGAARALGLAPAAIEDGLRTFEGLPHRAQVVAESDGVTFVNDSKATNVASAARALAAFGRIRWICGGQEKDGGLDALAEATGNVVRAYVIGNDAKSFAARVGVESEACVTMARAVSRAMEDARPGETVLLAPAAASFDQYENFEERGEDFVAEVTSGLAARAGAP